MAQNNSAQNYNPKDEEQQVDQMVAIAVEAAAKGENVEHLLEVMLSSLPASAKEKVRQKFAAALKKRNLRQPATDPDTPSRGALARIRDIFTLSARQAMERVTALVRSRPDLAKSIQQAGNALAKSGVMLDKVQVGEADLGNMTPLAGVGQKQAQRDTGRNS